MVITISHLGYIKRTPVSTYSRQGRGGKGRLGATAKNDDFVEHLFIASTHAYLMIFTDDGQVHDAARTRADTRTGSLLTPATQAARTTFDPRGNYGLANPNASPYATIDRALEDAKRRTHPFADSAAKIIGRTNRITNGLRGPPSRAVIEEVFTIRPPTPPSIIRFAAACIISRVPLPLPPAPKSRKATCSGFPDIMRYPIISHARST